MEQLRKLAEQASQWGIRGRSYKRSSLLFPLDTILEKLEMEPSPEMRDFVRAWATTDIYEHMKRVFEGKRGIGPKTEAAIKEYTNLFFDGVLDQVFKKDANRALAREKGLQSAYLFYLRDALARKWAERGVQAPTSDEDETIVDVVEDGADESEE